ncbi:MAG TPA: M13 family metallopeptidase [Gemmatimonadaceae bacterium]|nr:M13 family metallopeptidase [Gemmatimonadaceae bacterium]
MRLSPRRLTAAIALLLAAAAAGAQQPSGGSVPQQSKPLDPANLDSTCRACEDFYGFANGGWLKRTAIPAQYSAYGAFHQLNERNQDALRKVLDAAAADRSQPATTAKGKVGAFYATCVDSAAADRGADAAAPIRPTLGRVAAIRSRPALVAELARLHNEGYGVAFGYGAFPDLKNSTQIIAFADQGGLGLPDRDYYLKDDSASKQLRRAYVDHIARTLVLLGDSPMAARAAAELAMGVEGTLARASMPRVERRDPTNLYHKMDVAGLKALAPGLDWGKYLEARGITRAFDVNVADTGFVRTAARLLDTLPLTDWKAYLRWQVAATAAPTLGSAFVAEDFRFQQLLTGQKEMQPRWRRCLEATDNALGEALGQAYVEQYFTPAAKARALEMVHNLEAAMRERLSGLEWMGDSTRARAVTKLQAYANKIGYPDKWRDYSALEVRRDLPYAANARRAAEFETRRQMAKLGTTVDRTEWSMTPPTVNAYYNPLQNEIVFPAGIMQPPVFDPSADDAVNYGGMGAVIGHEISHGFDDMGRRFDATGNMADWWTAQDDARFRERAQRVVQQFNGYAAVDTLKVNGQLTLGENIADFAGLTIAYAAFQKALAQKGRPAPIDGFTAEQRFFLAWAQVWRQSTRPELARMLVTVDSHAPSRWRVNGPLSNMPEFQKAWGCKTGDPMVRGDEVRARIW